MGMKIRVICRLCHEKGNLLPVIILPCGRRKHLKKHHPEIEHPEIEHPERLSNIQEYFEFAEVENWHKPPECSKETTAL